LDERAGHDRRRIVRKQVLGVELGSRISFGFASGTAFAIDRSTLYGLNLDTGALTAIDNTHRAFFGIANSALSERTTWAKMLAGFGMIAAARSESATPDAKPATAPVGAAAAII
jgi:hypothetical protein